MWSRLLEKETLYDSEQKPNLKKNVIDSIYLPSACSVMSNSFATPWTVAHQAPLSMGFPRQEYWNGLPFPSPEDRPDLGIELKWIRSTWQVDSLLLSHLGSPKSELKIQIPGFQEQRF